MPARNDAAIRAALERLMPGAVLPGDLEARPVAGGLATRSFVVRVVGGAQVLVRLPLGEAPPLLDLPTEALVMSAAAAAGIAPRVLGADAAGGVLVTEYLPDARSWTRDEACAPEGIARLVPVLRKLHALDVAAPAFAAAATAQRYVTTVAPRGGRDAQWADELVRRARDLDAAGPHSALCHNDLFAANVLAVGERLMLVDFEYAVRAPPLLDLAGYAAMNVLAREECMLLLAEYHRAKPVAAAIDELRGAMRLVRLFAYFWASIGRKQGGPSAAAYAELGASTADSLQREQI